MARTPTSSTTDGERRGSAGFTLVELMVVLAVLALAYGFIAPSLSRALGAGEVRVAGRELLGVLREARAQAITEAREVRFIVDGPAASYGAGQVRHGIPRGFDIGAEVPDSRRLTQRIAAIDFFPDGTSTGGVVVLAQRGGARAVISVDWLTGRVGVAE